MKKILLTALVAFVWFNSVAQNDSLVNRLDEVIIQADPRLKQNSVGYKVEQLSDSVLVRNTESFTNLLRFNSQLYLREYGVSGLSSASFRGTSASNTAVVWNGININSINNGQTDFNALTVSLFDGIDIRSGGGSLEYGSGAIGGTIHLKDNLKLNATKKINNQIVLSAGSYDSYNSLYKFRFSNSKLAVSAGISYNQAENDYPLFNTHFNNENGAIQNGSFNTNAVLALSQYSKLKFYSFNYLGERFFSGALPNPEAAKEKYQDFSNRFLLVYTQDRFKIKQEARFAYLTQKYKYFEDKDNDNYDYGKSKRYLLNYNLSYKFKAIDASITSYSEYESIYGKTNKIDERNRRQFSQSIIYNHKLNALFNYEVKLRQDFNSDYNVPFTFALGAEIKPLASFFIRANGSKNYRVPTYNDLYWPGQGNLDLIPESALQGELGVGFKNNKFLIDIGAFYIHAKDKIVWTPNGDPSRPGVWVPINISEVNNKGLEVLFNYKESFNRHTLQFDLNYSYTEAIDSKTKKQVIFVPKHLLKSNLGYNYKSFSFFYQQLFNGKIYTTESNLEAFVVPAFFVANIGVDFKLINTNKNQLILGAKINNVFNENYVVRPRRPMPNRNFNININYKF